MNVQAEIQWIVNELRQVNDPHLIEAFKQLLIYRKIKQNETGFDEAFERAMADKEAGRVVAHDDVRAKYDKWL